ncbi:MAG: hypothetical protein ABJA98_27490 [Acidobacteriota bacterium]
MGLLDDMKGLLTQYTSGAAPSGDTGEHFQQVAQSVDSGTLAQGIAAAMRSDQTPTFGQLVSDLFSAGSPNQKTDMLNTLLSAVGPVQRMQLASLVPGLGAAPSVTTDQATAIAPGTIQSIAQHAEQHDAGIVDKMSLLYAAHPTLVKTLGTAAMIIAMRKIAERHA